MMCAITVDLNGAVLRFPPSHWGGYAIALAIATWLVAFAHSQVAAILRRKLARPWSLRVGDVTLVIVLGSMIAGFAGAVDTHLWIGFVAVLLAGWAEIVASFRQPAGKPPPFPSVWAGAFISFLSYGMGERQNWDRRQANTFALRSDAIAKVSVTVSDRGTAGQYGSMRGIGSFDVEDTAQIEELIRAGEHVVRWHGASFWRIPAVAYELVFFGSADPDGSPTVLAKIEVLGRLDPTDERKVVGVMNVPGFMDRFRSKDMALVLERFAQGRGLRPQSTAKKE